MPSLSGVAYRLRIIAAAVTAPSARLPIPVEDSTYYDAVRVSGDGAGVPVASADLFAVLGPLFGGLVPSGQRDLSQFAALCRGGADTKDSCEQDVGRLLYGLIRALRPKTVIEVGVYKGAASCHIAQALADDGGSAAYHLVDISPSLLEKTRQNLERFGLLRGQTFHCADAAELAQRGALPPADFIFLDAEHSYQSVGRDLASFWPLARAGGLLVVHDSILWNGVRTQVNRFAQTHGDSVLTLATSGGSGISIMRKGAGP